MLFNVFIKIHNLASVTLKNRPYAIRDDIWLKQDDKKVYVTLRKRVKEILDLLKDLKVPIIVDQVSSSIVYVTREDFFTVRKTLESIFEKYREFQDDHMSSFILPPTEEGKKDAELLAQLLRASVVPVGFSKLDYYVIASPIDEDNWLEKDGTFDVPVDDLL